MIVHTPLTKVRSASAVLEDRAVPKLSNANDETVPQRQETEPATGARMPACFANGRL